MNILLVSLLGCLVVALPSASAQKVKWCVKSQSELLKCQHLVTKSPELECVLRTSVTECLISIKDGDADAITVDGEHIYRAGLLPYDLRPVIAEIYSRQPIICCRVLAVVKKDADFTINDLKGKSSCHSCFQRPRGWSIPIGRLVSKSKIAWDGPDDMPLEKAVSQFFSSSCIPGISKAQYPSLCQGCQGDCSCSADEKHSGDDGALQCLKSGRGQVAFVCHNSIPEAERQNYQLLCMDGTRKSAEDYEKCYLAREPHRTVMSRKDADSQQIFKVLEQIPHSDIISSDAFGGKDLIFSDATIELVELPKGMDTFIYLKEDYFEAMRALRAGNPPAPPQVRMIDWCTISHAEHEKCHKINALVPQMACKRALSVEECIQKIMRKEADAIAVDSGQVYIAGKCGLVPVMIEQYDPQSCPAGGGMKMVQAKRDLSAAFIKLSRGTVASSYYGVAVVRKGSGITWSSLQGRKSCHTGLNRNGWIVPGAAICGKTDKCTLYSFFSKGCAPGADHQSNMCELCKGSEKTVGGDESKCKASSDELYYGYDGAFRCLAEKTGEVAFIKHTIVGDYTDGKGPDWAEDLKSEDFELICPETPDISVKHDECVKCNLAKVPAHAVITREDVRTEVVNVLKQAQGHPDILFKSENKRNLLFTDSTKCLQETTQPLEEFLSKQYIDMIERTYLTGQDKPDLVKACTLSI